MQYQIFSDRKKQHMFNNWKWL